MCRIDVQPLPVEARMRHADALVRQRPGALQAMVGGVGQQVPVEAVGVAPVGRPGGFGAPGPPRG